MKKPIIPDCKNFSGYKPCFPNEVCYLGECKSTNPTGVKILIINLDAMGDVIMTTAQLPALKRKFPVSTIYWITLKNALPLLYHNKYIDNPLEYNFENILFLQNIDLDYVFNADKSKGACSLYKSLEVKKEKYGFTLDSNGKIIPENEFAFENYIIGIDDHLKFKVNTKSGQEILANTFNLEYNRDKYILNLTVDEKKYSQDFIQNIPNSDGKVIVGYNTGCSNLYPNKKMTIDQHVFLINELSHNPNIVQVLLGGPEDKERNQKIKNIVQDKVILTPTNDGIRKGLCYINCCDVVITGDSFGMHAAIGLNKYVIAWFGLSCQQEIDLYDFGIKLYPKNLECSPCWKKVCPNNLECISSIDLNKIIETVNSYIKS